MSTFGKILECPRGVVTCCGALLEHLMTFKLSDVFLIFDSFEQFQKRFSMQLNSTTLRFCCCCCCCCW